MRWFITDNVPDLVERLTAAGEQVVSEPSDWVSAHLPRIRHPRDYLLRALAEARRPDVVVLVNPLRLLEVPGGLLEFGYFRQMTQDLRRQRVKLVLLSQDDPSTWRRFAAGQCPGCVCRSTDGDVYVSSDPATAAQVKGLRIAAFWKPGEEIGQVLAALAFARSGNVYRPMRDRDRW